MVQTTLFNEKLLNLFKLHIINKADTDKYTKKYYNNNKMNDFYDEKLLQH